MLPFDSLAVFPLHPVEEGKCGCGDLTCRDAGKHPFMLFGQLGVAEKWQGPEGCGFGIATGHRSGVFVVDIDMKDGKNGLANLAALGVMPETFTVATPTGGWHLYYSLPDFPVSNSRGKLCEGVDLRGEGGFVVAPFSPHANGGTYTIARDVPIVPAPAWLLAWPGLRGSSHASKEPGANAPIPVSSEHPDWARRLTMGTEACKTWAPSIQGNGGSDVLFGLAMELVRKLELPLDVAHELITEHYNGRCEPEWSDSEIDHKLESARDNSDRMPGIAPPTWAETVEQAAKPAAIKACKPMGPGARRTHVTGHAYSFVPGEGTVKSDASKTPVIEVAFILSSHELWHGVLQYDEFRRRVWAVDPPLRLDAEGLTGLTSVDVSNIRMWLQSEGVLATKDDVYDAVMAAARRMSYHPVKEYLESCRAKRVPGILDRAATCLFGTSPEANIFLRKTMISAVRRILRPGVKVDTLMVLHGAQGTKKSTFVRELFGADVTRSQMPDLGGKEASNALRGYWGVELAELDRVLRAETSTVKEFLTRQDDDYRRAYERDENKFPRECVFVGTVNESDFLRDSTGNRRFWPVDVRTKLDLDWLLANRDAMWGEALYLAETDEPHWMTDEEERAVEQAREQFVQHDAWHDDIRDFLKGRKRVKTNEVYEFAIARGTTDKTKYGRAEQLRVTDTLRRLGCVEKKTNGERMWMVPESLAALATVDLAKRFSDAMRIPAN